MMVWVQEVDFDFGVELIVLCVGDVWVGVLVSFVGLVCDINEGVGVLEMMLEYYFGMIEKVFEEIVVEVQGCWNIYDVLVIYCVGLLLLCDQIVFVVVISVYCGEVFVVCEFIMDYLKIWVLFWKCEVILDGVYWVDVWEIDDIVVVCWDKW